MDDDHDIDGTAFLDADDRALALHEAGHAIVAHELGAKVVFVQLKMKTACGLTGTEKEFADDAKNLAVCVAGCMAEHVFAKPRRSETHKGDFRKMLELLRRQPEGKRRAALAGAYRRASKKLRANTDAAHRIADVLLDRGRWDADGVMCIEREEFLALLDCGSWKATLRKAAHRLCVFATQRASTERLR
jgi:hypothetical protein